MKKGFFLPSYSFNHKLLTSGLGFTNIYRNKETNTKVSALDSATYQNSGSTYLEITLLECEGIPIPDESTIPRKNLQYREIYITLFDENKNQ